VGKETFGAKAVNLVESGALFHVEQFQRPEGKENVKGYAWTSSGSGLEPFPANCSTWNNFSVGSKILYLVHFDGLLRRF
jgi:hypothetical protein